MVKMTLSILVGVLVAGPIVVGERATPGCVQTQMEMTADAGWFEKRVRRRG